MRAGALTQTTEKKHLDLGQRQGDEFAEMSEKKSN